MLRVVAGLTCLLIAAAGDRLLVAQEGRGSARPEQVARSRAAGAIVGRVYDPTTNAPVRRAQVEASNGGGASIAATTDDEGRFELLDLSAGEWRVTATKGGYVTWRLGQRRVFEIPPPVSLSARQRLTVEIPLTRGSVVTGRVYDEAGEPLAGLQVRVYRARMAQGYRRLEPVGAADRTDDTGAYRIYGLPPGEYYVAASLRVAPPDSLVETTYAPTYFPGTGDLAEAQRVRLELGAEVTAAFPLLPVRQIRVSGTVLTSTGAPANAFLNLASEATELGAPLGVGGVTRADGTFTLPNVTPGRYVLIASLRGDGPPEAATIPLTVTGEDMTGAALMTGRPATIRGRFVADAGVSRAVPRNLTVIATAARAGGTVLDSVSGVAFELGDLAEPFYLRVEGLAEGWALKGIVVNDVDVTDSKIGLGPGQEVEARIVLTDRATEISGIVKVGDRPAGIVVFPEDSAKWAPPWRHVRVTRADERGRFRIAGLPAGERYAAIATDYLEEGEHNDPEFLGRMREAALRFQLGEGERRALALSLVER